MSEAEPVLYTQKDGIAEITLNRPDALNAMTDGLMSGISEAIETVVKDQSVRVVILTGEGRGFCAGADLQNASQSAEPDSDLEGDNTFNAAMSAIAHCPVPTIARVNGPAAGGGFGLALACDITIAAESAFFVATFVPKLGIVPDMGVTWSVPLRTGRARALGIILLGDRIPAKQAQEWGLIWTAVPDAELDAEVARVAERLKHTSPSAVTRTRAIVDAAPQNSFNSQLDLEMEHQAVLYPRNMQEGARAFLERRAANFSGERD